MPLKTFTAKNFFDRNNDMEVLKGVASEALAGDATDVFLSGRWGVGKTELLKHMFNYLFWKNNYVIPFFYTVNTSCISVEDFSREYLSEFIIQSLAYLKKDYSMMDAGVFSLEDLIQVAGDADAGWAVRMIEDYIRIREKGDPVSLLSFAVSAPYNCYLNKGIPVFVMIDDFHKAKKLYKFDHGDSRNLWQLFEKTTKSRYAPHIFSGFQPELYRMFFEETSFGEHIEMVNLAGIDRNESVKYFTSLCELYGLDVEADLTGFIDIFQGNPFYIKSFAQAARQTGRSFSGDDLWKIYLDEITGGKIFKYWTTRLKTYISKFSLRKPSLGVIEHLSSDTDTDFDGLAESLSVRGEELEYITGLLHAAGVVETGFSLMELVDDQVLLDVLKGLYQREINREPADRVRELIMGEKQILLKEVDTSFFDITIPSAPRSELIAVKSLQQIARHYHIPPDATGQMQIALVELFTGILSRDGYPEKGYELRFRVDGKRFSVEIITSLEELEITADESRYIREYIDGLSVERILKGVKITLQKELSEDFASAS